MEDIASYKVVLIGNLSTGKTCLINRIIYDAFEGETRPTTGSNIFGKDFQVGLDTIKLNMWDTAGQERFHALNKIYYANAAAIVVVYAADDNSSQNIMTHINAVRDHVPDCALFLACNKIDLNADNQEANIEAGKKIASEMDIPFYEVSAKNGTNVVDMYQAIAIKLHSPQSINIVQESGIDVSNSTNENNTTCKC